MKRDTIIEVSLSVHGDVREAIVSMIVQRTVR